jgi:hypothetical protein
MEKDILSEAISIIRNDVGKTLDDITLGEPYSDDHQLLLLNIISKVSSFMGNIFEFRYSKILTEKNSFNGKWVRNDPDFPDLEFYSDTFPEGNIGIEIKAWFPLATEITGRFKESQLHLKNKNIDVVIIAWIPDQLFFGKPKIINCMHVPALEVAQSRDNHYYNPSKYLLEEPVNTENRTRNLQQRNVNGYRLQEDDKMVLGKANEIAEKLSVAKVYNPNDFKKHNQLRSALPYRLDTNFAKIDRINNQKVEKFKNKTLAMSIKGKKLSEWRKFLVNQREN